jgi:PKD repeat protein
MKHSSRVYWLTCVLTILGAAASLHATTIVMPTDEQLVAKTPLIVIGSVVRSEAIERDGGRIWTQTTLDVEQTLKGTDQLHGAKQIVIGELGGLLGDRITKIYGAPEYTVGERVLAFVTPTPRGDYQTIDLFVGKFTEARTAAGERLWVRHDETQDAVLLDAAFRPIESSSAERDADGFERSIGERVAGREAVRNYGVENPVLAHTVRTPGAPKDNLTSNFTLISEPSVYRWSTFDTGGSARWFSYGTQPGYTGGGVNEIRTAMSSWNSYTGAKINYQYIGVSTASPGGNGPANGVNEILFNDPRGEISGAWNPSTGGVVGQGGFNGVSGSSNWTSTFAADASHQAGTFRAFNIVEGNLVIQDNVSTTTGISSSELAEIVAHEFGHTLGFGHSTDRTSLMYPSVTGLGPSLRADDQLAARWLYPSGSAGTTPTPTPTVTIPPPPSGLSATVSGTNVSLAWTDNASNESGQRVYVAQGTGAYQLAGELAASQRTATVTGFSAGTWKIYVTSWNSAGESTPSNIVQVTVASALAASFVASPTTGIAGQTNFTFTDQSAGTITARAWDFGDGFTASGTSVAHIYNVAGGYTVTLTVSGGGQQASTTRLVTVTAPSAALAAAFTWSPANPQTQQTITFADQSAGSPTAWQWNFGDGSALDTNQNPAHRYATAGTFNVTLTIFRAAGSSTTTRSIQVASSTPALPPPTASFAPLTANPVAGQPVGFSDQSSNATSWSWNFGDGGASSLQNPAHTYALAGTYTVTLTVSNATSSSTTARTISVAAAGGAFRSLVSAAAQTNGVGGSVWRTELSIFNAGTSGVTVQLIFVPSAGASVQTRSVFLSPKQLVTYDNALLDVFGMSSGTGAIAIESNGATFLPDLKVSSRTFTNGSTGTYGQAVPDVNASAMPQTLYLTGLEADEKYRTNVGIVNNSLAPVTATLVLTDADGHTVGTANLNVGARTFQQSSLVTYFPAMSGIAAANLSLRVAATAQNALSVYASVIDNRTQDPVYIQGAPAPGGSSLILPAVGRAPGANGTFWRSDVTLFNPNATSMHGSLRFLAAGSDNSSGATRAISLAPGQTSTIADVLSFVGLTSGSGALEVLWTDVPPVVTSRTYTTASAGGTYGQSIDPVAAFTTDTFVPGLRSDASFRSNIGFVNGSTSTIGVAVTLLSPLGQTVATGFVALPPKSQGQYSLTGLFPNVNPATLGTFTLQAHTDTPSLFAYGSIVDNASGDPVFFAAR